jgi:hypothetical protein
MFMKIFTKKACFALILTAFFSALLFFVPLRAKADANIYTLKATDEDLNLAALGKKDRIADGNYGTNGYFKFVGMNIRANSDTLIIELAKREGSSIQFTVTGAANLFLEVASNGNSNDSDCILIRMDDNKEIVPQGYEKPVFVVSGSDPTAVSFLNLSAGTYMLRSPEGTSHDNRGFRLFSAKVAEYPDGNIPQRSEWGSVNAPKVEGIKQDKTKLIVTYSAKLGYDGGDYLKVDMKDSEGNVVETRTVTTEGDSTEVSFVPEASGEYSFTAVLGRYGEEDKAPVDSAKASFLLPLKDFEKFTVTNMGGGSVMLEWATVPEAENYVITFTEEGGNSVEKGPYPAEETKLMLTGLTVDKEYDFTITAKATGTPERKISATVKKIVRNRLDRTWTFAYFGQSVNGSRNLIEDLNEDAFTFKLKSCTFNEATGEIIDKGGKFTAYYDGISYYYTQIDAANENFELTATFTVDYINPTPDGQEGFGLVIRDSIGENGVSNKNFETNSASIIATKFESTQDGTKYSMKDGLGVRFTYGLTAENIADGTMSTKGTCKTTPCQYESGNLINKGDVYTLTIKKTNTGYHCIYNNDEYILYGVDKLLVIDPEHVYVGFAVARGCNVTVSDVKFSTSDPKNDPPAQPEPDPKFNVGVTIVSSDTSGTTDYTLRFRANADGTAYVTNAMGKKLAENLECKANEIFEVVVPIAEGSNNLIINFAAKEGYVNELGEQPSTYFSISKSILVNVRKYPNDVFYVAPGAKGSGAGTREDPTDIFVAISFVLPGQKIVLLDGTYDMKYQIKIVKGNNGTADAMKYMVADEGAHPVFDFSNSPEGGFVNWGHYWYFEGFDVCNTRDNLKGFQLAGSNCVARNINTYNNGDTGFQISGSSNDPKAEWPKNNTVIDCTSHDNADSAFNNADGFAAKLSVGEGNRFIGCISYNNIDDGWDLYAKVETGPIGAVTIEKCVAFNNGFLSDGRGYGDGNGFKLGGDGISVEHVLKDSIAYGNRNVGITSNSNPSCRVYNCISYGNSANGIALYGKGEAARNFELSGVISMKNGSADNTKEQELASASNYLWTGSKCANSEGKELTYSIFASTDLKIIPTRNANGSINMNGLLEFKEGSKVENAGAAFDGTKDEPGLTIPADKTEQTPTDEPVVTPTDPPTGAIPEPDAPERDKTVPIIIAVVAGTILLFGLCFLLVKRYQKKKKK